jgi:hypothetical protein
MPGPSEDLFSPFVRVDNPATDFRNCVLNATDICPSDSAGWSIGVSNPILDSGGHNVWIRFSRNYNSHLFDRLARSQLWVERTHTVADRIGTLSQLDSLLLFTKA